jgi:hypothetical protein
VNAPVKKEVVEFAEHELGGKLMQVVVAQLEGQRKSWNELPEDTQAIALNAMTHAVDAAVRAAVHIIASDNRSAMQATVESVTFKDGVKAVLSLLKGPAAHDLADAEGHTALVIVGDLGKFTEGGQKVEPEPGQGRLPLHGAQDVAGGEAGLLPPLGEELPVPEAAPVPEVHKLKDGKFEIVIGPDKLHYPESPESFKTAARAEDWLQKHMEKQEETLLATAIEAFKAGGKAEGEKPDEERSYEDGFERVKKQYPADFFEEHYTELSAGYADGFEEGTDTE